MASQSRSLTPILQGMREDDLDAIGAILRSDDHELLIDIVHALRADSGKPPNEAFESVFDAAWKSTLRSQIEAQLSARVAP